MFKALLTASAIFLAINLPAMAQYMAPGTTTRHKVANSAPFAGTYLAPGNFALRQQGLSKLPQTRLDSFVEEARSEKEHIYGDEGIDGPPPYEGFNVVHRINNGIFDERDTGLTTGHGSYMPDAWGDDEFIAPPGEWSQSGANGGDRHCSGGAGSQAGGTSGGQGGNGGQGGSGGQGGNQNVVPPYEIGANWAPVVNTHNGQIMGWMAPGETYQQFFSGQSGHLLPGWEAEGQYILENQLGGMPSSPWG